MFQRLQSSKNTQPGPKALIMSPTRELALQTFRFTKLLGKYCDFRAAVILGGDKMESQFEIMHENPDIIIATPGRFLHICIEMNFKLSSIEYVVFDEADRLFEMGFKEQLNEILHKLPTENRQTLLFSATLPQSLVEFAKAGLQNPTLIRLDVDTKLSENLKLAYFNCREEDKLAFLIYLLNFIIKPEKQPGGDENKKLSQTVIFVATKHHVEFLKDLLEYFGYSVSYAYSSLDQTARKINIAKFQNKKTSLLIVTDVAARGIDIPMLDNVINLNFPAKPKLFVHRVGRVARAGESGTAYSILANDEVPYLFELNEYLGKSIKLANENDDSEWNEVYGSVPQAVIDIEKENIENLINAKIDLSSAFKTQSNAYKQYLKSRQAPNTNAVKMSKKFRLSHPTIPVQPLLKVDSVVKNELNTVDSSFLEQLKNYQTKTTIFEINKTQANQKSALIMRNKREKDEKHVEKFHTNSKLRDGPMTLFEESMYRIRVEKLNNDEIEEPNDDVEVKTFHDENLEIKIKDSNDDSTQQQQQQRGKKRKSFIDTEHFIPYKQKNYETEKALGVNNSFERQASQAAFDITGDDNEEIRRNMQKSKWDRRKKKFVNVGAQEKEKKFKTESGAYISKSFKSNLYSKWLKKSKKVEADMAYDEEQSKSVQKSQKFFGPEKRFFGSHKYKSTGKPGVKRYKKSEGDSNIRPRKRAGLNEGNKNSNNKPFRNGLKTKESIIKERNKKAKFKSMQSKNKNKKGGMKSGKKRF